MIEEVIAEISVWREPVKDGMPEESGLYDVIWDNGLRDVLAYDAEGTNIA